MKTIYKLKSKVLVYSGSASWRFLMVPKKESAEIKEWCGRFAKPFGSIPVTAKVGKTEWKTSIFPDKNHGGYLLPIKSEVRKVEEIKDEDLVRFEVKV